MIHWLAWLMPLLAAAAPAGMVRVPGGEYTPFYSRNSTVNPENKTPVRVKSFAMDRAPVTNADFLQFVRKNPEWRKSRVPRIQADSHYLHEWAGDLNLGKAPLAAPVTSVSWFAAQAYCENRGAELPTVDQWEYAFYDEGREREAVNARILQWYGSPNARRMGEVRRARPNGFGIYDLAGLVWEWNLDFNSFMVTNESRAGEGPGSGLFCGNGSTGAANSADYASFMRYSFRFSLQAAYTTANLGFRCVKGEAE